MLWIIQNDLYNDNRRDDLVQALTRLSIPFQETGLSSTGELSNPPVDENSPILTNGSVLLSKVALKRGWRPGSLFGPQFDFEVWGSEYRGMTLNDGASVTSIEELDCEKVNGAAFVRPVKDDKSFNGRVFSKDEIVRFKAASLSGTPSYPDPSTRVLVSRPKVIGQEHRHYIVDGEIVTSSRYKLSGTPNFSEGADSRILDFVKKAISVWTPARAFVLDTYVSGDEIGIVEPGCICHAGLYRSDVLKLVAALDSMEIEPTVNPKGPHF